MCTLRSYISNILSGYYELYVIDKKKYKKNLKDLKTELKKISFKQIKAINFGKKVQVQILLFRLSSTLYCNIMYMIKNTKKGVK